MGNNTEDLIEEVHHLIHKLYTMDPEVIAEMLQDRSIRRRVEESKEMLESVLD
jgi:hypothetical protein